MALFAFPNLAMRGLGVALPETTQTLDVLDWLPEADRQALKQQVGIWNRHIAPAGMTTGTLMLAAAVQTLQELDWQAASLDYLLVVTQTGEYQIPGLATVLHKALGCTHDCLALEYNLGCSGYVYGLWQLAMWLQQSGQRGLLLVGDASTHCLKPKDKSTVPIFSDAAAATALEVAPGAPAWHFNLKNTGQDYQAISMDKVRAPVHQGDQVPQHLTLDGVAILNFALKHVLPSIPELLEATGTELLAPRAYVLHQANRLINEMLRRKLGLPEDKVPYSLHDFGNTSSATIPITMAACLQDALQEGTQQLVLCGFGTGLSWGAALVEAGPLRVAPFRYLPADTPTLASL